MFLCKLKLRSSLHHIVFALLLLVESSFIAPVNGTVTPIPIVQLNTTQVNCLSCTGNEVNVSSSATVGRSFKAISSEASTLPPAKNLSTFSTGITLTPAKASDDEKNSSTALSFTKQAVSTDHAPTPPTTSSQPAAFIPSNSSAPPAGTATGTSAAKLNATTVKPVENVNRTTAQVTAESGVATASTTDTTPVLHQTTTKPLYEANTSTTSTITTTTAKTTQVPTTGSTASATTSTPSPSSPPSPSSSATSQPIPSTRLPFSSALPGNNLPSTRTVSGATVPATTTSHNALVRLQTTAAVVEVLGGALSRQLANTAFLLAVLVCGSLLFLITVLVFVKQAYESYNRKDYSQVDYLINGMYSDSSV